MKKDRKGNRRTSGLARGGCQHQENYERKVKTEKREKRGKEKKRISPSEPLREKKEPTIGPATEMKTFPPSHDVRRKRGRDVMKQASKRGTGAFASKWGGVGARVSNNLKKAPIMQINCPDGGALRI